MLTIAVILILCYGVYGAEEQVFQPCSETGYEISHVFMDLECPNLPCCLPSKRAVNTTIAFMANNIPADDIVSKVYAVIEGSMRDCDVQPKNCPSSVCPIYENDEKQYSAQFECNIHVDPVFVNIYWEMFNHKAQKLFCFYVPLVLYDPSTDDCQVLVKNLPQQSPKNLPKQSPKHLPKNKFSNRH